jgi:peroxiredoxin
MALRIWWGIMGCVLGCAAVPAVASAANCKAVIGGQAPQLQGAGLDGQAVSLDSMRGKWVYIDFWASWCKPCMKELPNVVELHESLGQRKDFAVVSIALDDPSTLVDLQRAATHYRVNYPVMCDSAGWSSPQVQEWCVDSIPATYLIDPEGKIVERNISPGDVEGRISRLKPSVPSLLTPAVKMPSFSAKHRLLRDSPTTGKRANRDLQISLPRPVEGTVRYQLVVKADQPLNSSDRTVMVRYDLEFNPTRKATEFPFDVSIREASGARVRTINDKPVTTNAAAADVLPGAQIAYDELEHRLLFILPLPANLVAASYTVSLYDPAAKLFNNTLAADISTI